ncbi:hypothetical protein CPB86DRAFT_486500 [Serendipita vermifera]|nr:hypothetical protein CPB86DRAFT_486500 [Serendipita vermifera]
MPAGWNGYGQQGTQPQPPTQQYNPNLNTGAQTESLDRAMGAMKLNNGAPSQPRGATGAASGSGSTQHGRHTPRGGGGDRGSRRGRGGNRGNGHPSHQAAQELKIPTTDFDFQANNNRFVKTSIPKPQQILDGTSPDGTTPTTADAPENATATLSNEAAVDDAANATEKKEDEKAYNPSKSFFDNISSDLSTKKAPPKPVTAGAALGDRGPSRGGNSNGGGRGRGGGRSRRDEERERNLETFGEPGGVGMMGPGAYVGGYGGYRGKRRRGGPGARGSRGGAPKAIAQHSG